MDFRLSKFSIDIPILLVFFGAYISDSINANFVLYRTCYVIFGYNQTDCSKLGEQIKDNATKELLQAVQPQANTILMSASLLSSIIPSLLCLFIGPWSDKHGRKPFILITLAGFATVYCTKMVISLLPWANPWFLLLDCIPIVLSGGFPTFIMICLCYATDISTTETRGMRMAIFEGSLALGIFLGSISCSYIYHMSSYTFIFLISTFANVTAFVFTLFFVKESIVNTSEIQDSSGLFSLHHIKDMVVTTIKGREGFKRPILFLTIAALAFYILAVNDGNLMFMYLINKFGWSLEKFTIYSSITSVFFILGSVLGVYLFHKVCKISETTLLLFCFAIMSSSHVLTSLAIEDWQIYLAAIMRSSSGILSPMLRSLISKIVSTDEVGKIFAFTVAIESFAGIMGTPLYTLIYNNTYQFFPGGFTLFAALVYLIEVVIILSIIVLRRCQTRSVPYNELVVN